MTSSTSFGVRLALLAALALSSSSLLNAQTRTVGVNTNGVIVAPTNFHAANRLPARAVSNYLHATTLNVDCSTDFFGDITNATSANVSLQLTNLVIGRSGSLRLQSDGSARTIALLNYTGATLTPMSTNWTINATNVLTTASKHTLLCWRVSQDTATSPLTNLLWWASNAP